MADSFFELINSITASKGLLDEGLHDEPGQGLDDEEEEYDALNDETFGTDALEGDWEEDHEKLAEIAEQSRQHQSSYNEELDDLDLEANLAHLVLEDDYDDDDVVIEHSDEERQKEVDNSFSNVTGYSSSAPTDFSVWSVGKLDAPNLQTNARAITPKPIPGGKNVCTVEELERGLIQNVTQSTSTQKPPSGVLRVEDIERDLTTPASRGVRQIFPQASQDLVVLRNAQNSVGRNVGFPPHLPPVLGLNRPPQPPNGPFVVPPPRMVGPPGIHPAMLHQQNHRLMGSNPNILRFLPPHLIGPHPSVGKGLPHHQVYPGENGMLRPLHHRSPNMPYRPGFPVNLEHFQNHAGRHQQLYNQQQWNGRSINNGYNRFPNRQQNGDFDEYAGLMTQRERQWLLNIQLLQLNTAQSHIEDYYYTVFVSRQPKSEKDVIRSTDLRDSLGHRERRDSQRSEQGTLQPRVYTPAQFENSLGKLQVGSIMAPRKIIDMDIVSTEALDTALPTVQKDSRKTKQLLLEIERLYLLLLQVEDLSSPVPEIREAAVDDKTDLLQKITNSLLMEDRLVSIMCVRKGKKLVLRFLPLLAADSPQLAELWNKVLWGLVSVSRRDTDGLFEQYQQWITHQPFSVLLQQAHILEQLSENRTTSPVGRNFFVFCLTNKFVLSLLGAILERAETLQETVEENILEEWSNFVQHLADAAETVTVLEPLPESLDQELITRHLERHCRSKCQKVTRVFSQTTESKPITSS